MVLESSWLVAQHHTFTNGNLMCLLSHVEKMKEFDGGNLHSYKCDISSGNPFC